MRWCWEECTAIHCMVYSREYELKTEAHAQVSVVQTAPDSPSVCVLGEEKKLAVRGVVSSSKGQGDRQYTGRENLEQFRTTES